MLLLPLKFAALRAREAAVRRPEGTTTNVPASTTIATAPPGQEDFQEVPGAAGITTAPRPPRIVSVTIIFSSGTRRSIANAPALGIRATPRDNATPPNPLGSASSSLKEDASRMDATPAPREAVDITPAIIIRRKGTHTTEDQTSGDRETFKATG